jgi:type II secretory pathway component PulF
MPRFHYQALNADRRLVTGEVEADAVAAAIEQLEASGLTVQSIGFAAAESTAAPALPKESTLALAPRPPAADETRDELILRRHLASTLDRARPLTPALRAYAEELPTDRRRAALQEVCRVVERGDLVAAQAAFVSSPEYWIPLIGSTGAANGSAGILQDFMVASQQTDESRRQWWTLLAYPLFLIGFAALVLVLLAHMVVPTFRSIFDDFDLALPTITVWTIRISEWLASGASVLTAAILLIVVAALINFGGPKLADLVGAWFGRSTALSLFAGSTAHLLAGGISLPDAVRIAGRPAKGTALRIASQRLASLLEAPTLPVPERMQRSLSSTILYAATAEMPTSARVQLLQAVSACFADRSRSRASWTQGLLGPLTIFVVGFLVALVALSLFLPLVNLINNLSG